MKNLRKQSRFLCFVFVLLLLGMVGCQRTSNETDAEEYSAPSENQFDAVVLEVHDEYLLVEAVEGQVIAGEVKVWLGRLSEDEIPELEEGMTVRITHDGKMTMSIPAQISATERITIISL